MVCLFQVFDFFKTRIEHQYPLDPTPEDPLEAQKSAHEVRGKYAQRRDGRVIPGGEGGGGHEV